MALAEDHNYALAAEPAQIDNLGHSANRGAHTNILDPGFDLTLRPMRYPQFFEMYKDAIKNTWTVEEIDFSDDLTDLDRKLMPAEKHLISRLVAFFATGDSIVANNLVLNLIRHFYPTLREPWKIMKFLYSKSGEMTKEISITGLMIGQLFFWFLLWSLLHSILRTLI